MLKKNLKILISLVLLIIIGFGIYEIFNIEKKIVNEENSQKQNVSELPLPSRIIYKNKYNKYKVMNSEDKYFAEVYTLLYSQSEDYTEDNPELEKENISFVECTYIVRNPSEEDKNYIFLLGDQNSELEKKYNFTLKTVRIMNLKKPKVIHPKNKFQKFQLMLAFGSKKMGYIKKL